MLTMDKFHYSICLIDLSYMPARNKIWIVYEHHQKIWGKPLYVIRCDPFVEHILTAFLKRFGTIKY